MICGDRENETNECRYLLLNRSLLMAKKKKRNDFDTNEFQAFEFDVGESLLRIVQRIT